MSNTPFDDIETFIGEGELPRAINQLLEILKRSHSPLQSEALAIKSELRDIDRAQIDLRPTLPDLNAARRPVRKELIDLLERARRAHVEDVRPPVVQPAPATKPQDTVSADVLEKIIGADRMKPLAWLRRGLTVARAVCRVETPAGLGSGFLVEGGVLVTNAHVLRDAATVARSTAVFNYEEDETGNLLLQHRYKLDASRYRVDTAADCVAVRVDDPIDGAAPLSEWGFLELSTHTPQIGDFVSIIQHPYGGPKQIALSENQVTHVIPPTYLHYTTDTYRGSSGSPVFDDEWRVIAVHHAGGNLSKRDGTTRTHFTNEGILTAALRKAVLT